MKLLLDAYGWVDVLNALRDETDAGISGLSRHPHDEMRARQAAAMHLNEAREQMAKIQPR